MLTPYDLASVSPGTRLRNHLVIKNLKQHNIHRICDCGCGLGVTTKLISKGGIDAIGFDLRSQLLFKTKHYFPESTFFAANIEKIPLSNNSLEGLVICDVIEHLPNPTTAFQEITRILCSGSQIVLTTPNHNFVRICNFFRLTQAEIGHHRIYSIADLENIIDGLDIQIIEHKYICNPGVAVFDAATAKLASLIYGKEVVHDSEMSRKTASNQLIAWVYYIVCKLSYPILCFLEHILPASTGSENLVVLVRGSVSE